MANQSIRSGQCIGCHLDIALHFDDTNRMIGCEAALKRLTGAYAPVNRGRLFKMKVDRNRDARQSALSTVRELPRGGWQARVGGPVRGRLVLGVSRAAVERAVNDHYNSILHDWVTGHGARRRA